MFRIATFKIVSEEVLGKVKSGETDQLVTVIDIPSTGNPLYFVTNFIAGIGQSLPIRISKRINKKTPESVQTKSRQQ